MKLRNKLLISYIVFFFIPLCFFTMITFKAVTNLLEKNIIFSVEKNYNQTFSFLSEKFNKVKKTSDIILVDNYVNDMFIEKNDFTSVNEYYSMKKSMDFLGSFEDEDISRIVLFLLADQNFQQSYNFNTISSIKNSQWYHRINSSNANILWCPYSYLNKGIPANIKMDSTNLALIRRFYNPANYLKTMGYYCVYFKSKPIEDIVKMGDAVSGSVTFLQNSEGETIYTSNRKQYNKLFTLFQKRSHEKSITAQLKTCTSEGQKLIYTSRPFSNSDWSLITIVSNNDILSQLKLTQERIVLFTLVISIVCFTLAWMMARSMTKRILQLQNKMKQVQQGHFDVKEDNPYTDEIGFLTNTYDFMMEKIEELIEDRYKAGIQVKATELRALQEQINPHFLYNTLDTINWLAQKGSVIEVEKAISSLAEFYRLSLSSGNQEIPIHEELKRVSTYVQIQNIRFSGGINLVIDIDEEVESCLILKLLLQPFVENSILHGIMHKPSKEGYIIIEAMIDYGTIRIKIQDNGVGMSEEELLTLNEGNYANKHYGYAIKNVKNRILLNYGDQYPIKYSINQAGGITVELIIPVKYGDA